MIVGYCCNVHPGNTIDEVKANLERHALAVKRQCSPDVPLPIGLWLGKSALADIIAQPASALSLRDWLGERGLVPFTFNGFPYGDFHQKVVKKDVYLPTWAQQSRLQYTLQLVQIQRTLLDANRSGQSNTHPFQSISTLPLGWPAKFMASFEDQDKDFLEQSASHLKQLARKLHQLEQLDGIQTMVCIEPEPGCILDTADDIAQFFDQYLFAGNEQENDIVRRHIGVCHDICHSAVMFEQQQYAIETYQSVGATIGKVQVSSAVAATMQAHELETNQLKLKRLREFSEPRYLHQTRIRDAEKSSDRFYEDLNEALDDVHDLDRSSQWRVHFHVPLFLPSIDEFVDTTQHEVEILIEALSRHDQPVKHFEVETYAWNVFPDKDRYCGDSLADGIARELVWFRDTCVPKLTTET